MTQTPITIATLGDLRARAYTMTAWCRACDRNAAVDMDALIRFRGPDHPYTDQAGLRLRCSHCRSADVSITISPPTGLPIARGTE